MYIFCQKDSTKWQRVDDWKWTFFDVHNFWKFQVRFWCHWMHIEQNRSIRGETRTENDGQKIFQRLKNMHLVNKCFIFNFERNFASLRPFLKKKCIRNGLEKSKTRHFDDKLDNIEKMLIFSTFTFTGPPMGSNSKIISEIELRDQKACTFDSKISTSSNWALLFCFFLVK